LGGKIDYDNMRIALLAEVAALTAERDQQKVEIAMLRNEWSVMARACGNYRDFGMALTEEAKERRRLIADAEYEVAARAIIERASLRAGIEKLIAQWRERANERVRLVGEFHSAARQTYDICAAELSTLQEPK
jgi:hypothetical protein